MRDDVKWRQLLAESKAKQVNPATRSKAHAAMRTLRSRAISSVERGATSDMRDDYEASVKAGGRKVAHLGGSKSPITQHEATAIVAVPLWLSVKVTGEGSPPVSLITIEAPVGNPVVVTVKVPAVPTVKVA